MKKITILTMMLLILAIPCFAKDETSALPRNSLIGEYQAMIPCNAAGFGSNAATFAGIIPPEGPLKIVLEANFPSDIIKEALEENWYKDLDNQLSTLNESPQLYKCAYLCYNLGISIEIDYVSLIDGGVNKCVITPEQLEITFNPKKN